MPIGRSAKKTLRKTVKNHDVNLVLKNKIKLTIKNFLAKPTEKSLSEVDSVLDKGIKKHLVHKNKVARLKSNFSKKITVKRTAKEKMSK